MIHRTGRRRKGGAKGFTLIELLVVVAIIGILASAALPTYRQATKKAKESVLRQQLFTMRDLIDQHYVDKGKYPADLQGLVEAKYLRQIPIDPMTGASDTWQVEMSEGGEDTSPTGESSSGVENVHSGSGETALDGSVYSEW